MIVSEQSLVSTIYSMFVVHINCTMQSTVNVSVFLQYETPKTKQTSTLYFLQFEDNKLSKYAEKKKEMLKGEEVYGKHTHSNNFC